MNNLFKESKQFLKEYEDLRNEFEKIDYKNYMSGKKSVLIHLKMNASSYLWNTPNDHYVNGAKCEYLQIITKEIAELNDKGIYFHLCKFSIYKKTFKDRLNEFLETYEDAEPISFLTNELDEYLKPVTSTKIFQNLDQENILKLNYTRRKVIQFLREQALEFDYKITIIKNDKNIAVSYNIEEIEDNLHQKHPQIQWHGNQTEFIELIKALIENGTLKGTQKEIIQKTSDFFNIEIKNPDKLIQDIKKRNTVSATLFIDSLKSNLYDYITK